MESPGNEPGLKANGVCAAIWWCRVLRRIAWWVSAVLFITELRPVPTRLWFGSTSVCEDAARNEMNRALTWTFLKVAFHSWIPTSQSENFGACFLGCGLNIAGSPARVCWGLSTSRPRAVCPVPNGSLSVRLLFSPSAVPRSSLFRCDYIATSMFV